MASRTVPNKPPRLHRSGAWLRLLLLAATLLPQSVAWAVPIINDTRDFEGIPWGASFTESESFRKVEDTGRLTAYEVNGEPPTLGGIKVESMRFYAANGRFARVTVQYRGKVTYDKVVKYLESRYGELDRTPGQIAAGAVKFHNWHGDETDVTMRYEHRTDQGIIFFESQVWAPQLSEGNLPSGF